MSKNIYSRKREPFFDIALKYLPKSNDACILELGPGPGRFLQYGKLIERYKNLYVIENADVSVKILNELGVPDIIQADLADGIPLPDSSVDFIHFSHVVEHMDYRDVYSLMQEIDRVTRPGAVFVVSAPMMNGRFYNDLSHVKPYNPDVFLDYMSEDAGVEIRSRNVAAARFVEKELVYRVTTSVYDPFWYSDRPFVNFLIVTARKFARALGIRKYVKSGFTLVLQKQAS
ncbi:MAG: class I SAM-dependent methyltransferase [Fimbriimonadaceae bacterium]|nr:class I SAM-dependent methyltransferase [Alphaproteobacteria bacterium]